ncbi:hypothetical protein PCC7424_5435 (plasmid) [Gloeothece citriformis PCC 7424]|uniref:Uncharacterized protein n=1 Tax=Gloeothece citriformis (strain PCC 7424) TaxID=65393 RepID=B7KMI7_GLOC7|nr:hypothetical protein PCC7424_5435 [Gloeothece citriformis PCC 7424]
MLSKLLIFSGLVLIILYLINWLKVKLKNFYQLALIKGAEEEDVSVYFWAAVGVISCCSLVIFGIVKISLIVGGEIS